MADTSTPTGSAISVDVNAYTAAQQLREVGGWGVSIIFLILMGVIWRHFTKAIRSASILHNSTVTKINELHNNTVAGYVKVAADNEERHAKSLQSQRDEFITQMSSNQKEVTELLERRHEQFIQLIRDNQATMVSTVEINRREVELMAKLDETMKEVQRIVKRCKYAKAGASAASGEDD